MAQKKPKLPKFTGTLANRIKERRLDLSATQEERSAATFSIFQQRLEKLDDLLRFYGWKGGEKWGQATVGDMILVILRMAEDFVPGFQTFLAGRPKEKLTPETLRLLVETAKRIGVATTDEQACGLIAESIEPDLASPRRGSERAKRAKTLANRVAKARASKRRKAGAH
jgi:hypothetical protein